MSPTIRRSTVKTPRLLLFLAGLLIVCLAIQLVPRRPAYFFEPGKPLKDYLPGSAEGWTAEDRPLGATEYETAKAKDILRLDDYAFRTYRKGDVEFSIYCAYWRPGSQAIDEAAAHNPDLCWTNAGWKCADRDRTLVLQTARGPTWPGQYRIFTLQKTTKYVAFWHIYGGALSGYGMGAQANWRSRAPYVMRRLVRTTLSVSDFEQYLVRMSSNIPLDQLETLGPFPGALAAISKFGLVDRSESSRNLETTQKNLERN